MADSEKQAEFALDLFSDIAPLLALFGDEFAKQFASESLTWVDHLISAMVPLGILTTIRGAIRVQGPRIVRSFIGRGRETRALAEIELMSSTSKEVCELFNGKSIIRAIGKPKIAQILVFPEEYNRLQRKYNDEASGSGSAEMDRSCGIHTLETAMAADPNLPPQRSFEMKCDPYHSKSYMFMEELVKGGRELLRSSTTKLSGLRKPKGAADPEKAESGTPQPNSSAPESTKASKQQPGPSSKRSDTKAEGTDFKLPGPPNLQLGLSSDQFETRSIKKKHEIFAAAVIAVILQVGLLAIATITVYGESTRSTLSFDPEKYGYPCYIGGSILLCIGVCLCSIAIERNTTEYDWKILPLPDKMDNTQNNCPNREYPRLLWLQKSQEVNDQSFGGYVILAGPKHHIITSSRFEDTEQLGASATLSRGVMGPAEQHADPVAKRESNLSRVTKPENQKAKDNFTWKDILECLKHLYSLTKQDDVKWKGYTVCGAVAAGAGFIAQLIGLRGLAYPCSIAHLLAVVLMAFVRAMIRRRLGHVPIHRVAFSRYEIDYLATQLVYSRDFREQEGDFSSKDSTNRNKQETELVLRWKVKTAIKPAGPVTSDVTNVTEPLETPSQQTPTPAMVSKDDSSCQQLLQISATVSTNGSSCQQLLRVRERLGDLCEWQSTALEAAKSLALSIEAFMDTFFDLNKGGNSEIQPDWFVETVGLSSNEGANQGNFIHIPIQKSKTGNKWQTNVGIIEAILSLWMATIESTTKADKKKAKAKQNQAADASESSQGSSNWRYKKSGIDLRYKFCRIIGDAYDDDVLKRDLSWWVDELIADQSDDCYKAENDEPSWRHSNARTDMDLIIGFNSSQNHYSSGRKPCDPRTRELAISDANALPTILAQHLFTSFMWTVVEKLPRDFLRRGSENNEQLVNIEGRRAFDPRDFEKTWYCPTLRHRKLTKLVREIEKNGLGSYTDILLCMIPAFSSKDLLPNHAMLKLVPPMQHDHGSVATAGDYTRLLRTSIQTSPPEMLCYNVVVAVMDFLYLAYEPYDSFVKPHDDLMEALQDLTNELFTVKFEPILKDMMPLYSTQQRWKRFQEIFSLCGTEPVRKRFEALLNTEEPSGSAVSVFEDFGPNSLATRLGFSQTFKDLYTLLERKAAGSQRQVAMEMLRPFRDYQFNEGDPLDIFGWSPLHYAALVDYEALGREDRWLYGAAPPFQWTKALQIQRILDNIKRSPLHVAVAAGNTIAFREILGNFANEVRESTLNASGIDQMNTLHLATQSGSLRIVSDILEQTVRRPLTHSDFWGRGAIHIAASYGHDKIAKELLENGADPHSIDLIGKAPLDYVLKGDALFNDAGDPMEKQEAIKPNEGDRSEDHKLVSDEIINRKRKVFIALALKNPDYHDRAGLSFLHHAVQHTDTHTVRELMKKDFALNESDSQGRSVLHLAVMAKKREMVQCLLDGIGGYVADPAATDSQKETALIHAARLGLMDMVESMCSKFAGGPHLPTADNRAVGETEMDKKQKRPDPLATNLAGRTALHVAIEEGKNNVAEYLLNLRPLQDKSRDEEGISLLLTACRNGASGPCVDAIAHHWPSDINYGDPNCDQPPLSWACENGSHEIVEQLLKCADIDVNKPASQYSNYTPLHVAVLARSVKSINLLLDDARIEINAESEDGLTASALAVERWRSDSVGAFASHHKIDCQNRLELLEQWCVRAASETSTLTLVEDALQSMVKEELGDKVISKLFELSENFQDTVLWAAFARRALECEMTKMEVKPGMMHVAARLNDLELMRNLHSKLSRDAIKSQSVDEDGWTCIEYAKTYRSEPLGIEMEQLAQESTDAQDVHTMPSCLEIGQVKTAVLHKECTRTGHSKCVGIHVIEVDMNARVDINARTDEQKMPTWALLRTTKCVPPPSSRTMIYHEIKILEESASDTMIAIGFCNRQYRREKMPGWQGFSFGYHNDDGNLFVNWYEEHGTRLEMSRYHVGDTAGVGLNLETGEGFVTLNGELLETNEAFAHDYNKFNNKKMYPCVGYDNEESGVGLKFEWNLGVSLDTHPFMYKGFDK